MVFLKTYFYIYLRIAYITLKKINGFLENLFIYLGTAYIHRNLHVFMHKPICIRNKNSLIFSYKRQPNFLKWTS